MKEEYSDTEIQVARGLRLAVIRNLLAQDHITRTAAEELLKGCLTLGDETTWFDDSNLIDTPIEELKSIGIIRGVNHGRTDI